MRWRIGGLAAAALALAATSAAAETYTYDSLGRLTQVGHADGRTTTYAYDAAGNRTSVVTSAPPASQLAMSPSTDAAMAAQVAPDEPLTPTEAAGFAASDTPPPPPPRLTE